MATQQYGLPSTKGLHSGALVMLRLIRNRHHKYVALKIAIAEGHQSQESRILRELTTSSHQHPGYTHLPRLLDDFNIQGPNGCHHCVVLDIVGMNVGDLMSDYCEDYRLPAKLARSFAKQALLALDYMHDHAIVHGGM